MERLTFLDNGKPAFRFKDHVYKIDVADRLSAYEDTGITPEEITKMQAENAKLRELLKAAVKDFESVANNVAYDGFVCGEECAHFSKCDIFKNDDDRIYRCQKFKWRHADEAEKVLKNE